MEERYGRSGRGIRAAAVIFFAALIAFVAWSGWHYATTTIRTQVISFVGTDKSMTIRYQLTRRDAQTTVICRITAQDYQRKVVGEITDEIGPGLATMTRYVQVPTLKPAAAGFVGPCTATR